MPPMLNKLYLIFSFTFASSSSFFFFFFFYIWLFLIFIYICQYFLQAFMFVFLYYLFLFSGFIPFSELLCNSLWQWRADQFPCYLNVYLMWKDIMFVKNKMLFFHEILSLELLLMLLMFFLFSLFNLHFPLSPVHCIFITTPNQDKS